MKSQIRNIIIFVAIGLVFVFVYLVFIKGDNKDVPALVGTTSVSTNSTKNPTNTSAKDSEIAQDFLTLLLNVKNITLNDGLFSDKAFTSLRDSSILLVPDGNEGRPNPFAPIGVDIGTLPPQATPVVSTTTNNVNPPKNEAIEDFDFGGNIDFNTDIPGGDQIITN